MTGLLQRDNSGTLWIVTTWGDATSEGQPAMIVKADTEQEAAALGADWFTDLDEYADALPITHVFVASWSNRTAYRIRCAAAVAELQCCAGGSDNEYAGAEGHYATCDQRPPGTGQLRAGEDPR